MLYKDRNISGLLFISGCDFTQLLKYSPTLNDTPRFFVIFICFFFYLGDVYAKMYMTCAVARTVLNRVCLIFLFEKNSYARLNNNRRRPTYYYYYFNTHSI